MKNLTDRINNFDFFYEMSDSHEVYDRGNKEEKSIKAELSSLNENELREVLTGLDNSNMEWINRYFKSYFENIKPVSSRSKIFTSAWYYFKKGIYSTFSECLKAAWRAYKLTKRLRSGIIHFTYRKATGEIRQATGTLIDSVVKTANKKGVRKEANLDTVKYFDVEKDAWRMFRIERLLTA